MEEKKLEGKSKIIVNIENIHCGDCALSIERSVEHVPGVLSAEVSYVLSSATVYYDPHRVEVDRIKRAITKPGYAVRETLVEKTRTFWREMRPFLFMAVLGVTLALSWILRWIGLESTPLPTAFAIASLILGGYPIVKSAIKALLIPDLNVDTLVSIAAMLLPFRHREVTRLMVSSSLTRARCGFHMMKIEYFVLSMQLAKQMAQLPREY